MERARRSTMSFYAPPRLRVSILAWLFCPLIRVRVALVEPRKLIETGPLKGLSGLFAFKREARK